VNFMTKTLLSFYLLELWDMQQRAMSEDGANMAGLHRWHHRVSHCTYTYNFPSVIVYIFKDIICSSIVPISSATVINSQDGSRSSVVARLSPNNRAMIGIAETTRV